jgi:NADPH:quinone reductase-like Zn-dependent oxidoreductase
MRAIQYFEFGGPEVLQVTEVPDPHPGPGQIRVAVRAAGVNPIDWKVRSGAMGGDLPKRTGQEVAGVVDEVGPEVDSVAVGDAVFGPAAGGGGMAQLALLEHWAPVSGRLDIETAAGLPVAVETACRMLDLLEVGTGQTVVVNGAAGAVGISTVQLARERGARVIGTASEPNHEYLRSYGAEPTTYGDGLVERVRAIAADGVDRAIDAAGGGALPALVELAGGPENVITIADYQGSQDTGVRMTGGATDERAWYALQLAADLINEDRFSLPVAQTFGLDEIAEAHRLSETGHVRGKIIVLVD